MKYVELLTATSTMPVAIAEPLGGTPPKGAVIVLQEAFGVVDYIESLCSRFAAEGYVAIAPALYHRLGSPKFGYDDFTPIRPAMAAFTAEGLAEDLDACHNFLHGRGFELKQTAAVGFCMGDTVTLFAASRRALGAAATFYGGGLSVGRFGLAPTIEMAPHLQTPWLGFFGDLDQSIPVPDVELLTVAAATASSPAAVIRYADADHGFHCPDRPSVYNEAAANDAWARTLALFARNISNA